MDILPADPSEVGQPSAEAPTAIVPPRAPDVPAGVQPQPNSSDVLLAPEGDPQTMDV